MSNKNECSQFSNLEFRIEGEGQQPKIIGYAAVFNSRSQDLGGFTEIIKPGTFSRSLAAGADVRAFVDHNSSKIIGRTKSGTLKLREDERGLLAEISPANTTAGRDVVESIQRGDLDGMSFAFRTIKDEWRHEDGQLLRELQDVDLMDVSIVSWPAYSSTSVSMRSAEEILEEGKAVLAAGKSAIAEQEYQYRKRKLDLLEKAV